MTDAVSADVPRWPLRFAKKAKIDRWMLPLFTSAQLLASRASVG